MTDIHGNLHPADFGHDPVMGDGRLVPFHPAIDRPRDGLPFPYIDPAITAAALFLLYAAAVVAYAFGFVPSFPRTPWRDAAVAAAALPSLVAAGAWPQVARIPYVGGLLYLLPALALALAPFAFDFYLMYGR